MQNEDIEILQENPATKIKLDKANADRDVLETQKVRSQVRREEAEKRMAEIVHALSAEYNISIDDVPDFLQKAIPEKEEAVDEYALKVEEAKAFYENNLVKR